MKTPAGWLFIALAALAATPAFGGSIAVTISGNFGAPQGGSSVFDDQNYSINFLIPDDASPSSTICCLAQISATYDVSAHLAVPGIGLALDNVVQVEYNSQLPLGKWLNIFSFTGLPVGDFMVLTPFQINTGDLWNGLAGPLGTPAITPLNGAAGAGTWHLEQNTPNMGPIPIAVYSGGPMTITAAAPAQVPEPSLTWLVAGALLAAVLRRA
jgi:hypothetical protein